MVTTPLNIFLLDMNFNKSKNWITFSFYIFYTYKIFKKKNINNYIINKILEFYVFTA